jgi:hypothetical protein
VTGHGAGIVTPTIDNCLEQARRFEKQAEQSEDAALRAALINVAQKWRERGAALILVEQQCARADEGI